MAKQYTRAHDGKFARTADTAKAGTTKPKSPAGQNAKKVSPDPAKPARTTAQKVAIAAGIAVGVGAATGVIKVRHDALARYDARTAASLLRASDITSSWP